MARMTLTPDIARAAGWDAGNKSMRKAGRTRWNEDDYNVAADKTNSLMAYIMPPEVAAKMADDGLIPVDHPALTPVE